MRRSFTMMNALAITAAAIGTFPTTPAFAAEEASLADLEVVFEGIEEPTGDIRFVMFADAETYGGNGSAARAAIVTVTDSQAATTLESLKPGTYAIRAFHDVDGDGKMDTNPFGLPIEPFAFSNNAKAQGGPAPWEAASFEIHAGTNRIRITIK